MRMLRWLCGTTRKET